MPPSEPEELLAFSIDVPRSGGTEDIYALRVEGWVLGRKSEAVSVEVRHGQELMHAVPVHHRRRDVAEAHPDAPGAQRAGFRALVGVVGLPRVFELELEAVLADGARAPMGTVRAGHERVASGFEPRLEPLRVLCARRTGSTWLMRMLAAHPQIVVYPTYPYEYNAARYWSHMLKALSGPANRRHYHFPGDPWQVGPNPYYNEGVAQNAEYGNWFGKEYTQRLAAFCQKSIDDWYALVASCEGKSDPVYFAEKHIAFPGESPLLVDELYPGAKEVFLVRDFRDVVCSLMSFDERHGFQRPSDSQADRNEHYFRRARGMAMTVYENWRQRGERAHLIRYEELVLEPTATLTALLSYVGLESPPSGVQAMLEEASDTKGYSRQHVTSESLEASIGRWKLEADESFQGLSERYLKDVLDEFGYSVSAAG